MTHDTSTGGTLEDQFQDLIGEAVDRSKIEATETGYVYWKDGLAIKIPSIFNPIFHD